MNNNNNGNMIFPNPNFSAMPKFNSFTDFIQSPQALALGIGLLQGSGYSHKPISFGEALGQGLLNMQNVTQQNMDQQYKQAMLQNNLDEMGLKKKEIEIKSAEQTRD